MLDTIQPIENAASADGSDRPVVDAGYLLENLICDFHWSAIHAGILTKLVSHLNADERELIKAWKHLLQDSSGIALLGLRYSCEIGIDEGAADLLVDFYRRSSELKLKYLDNITRLRSAPLLAKQCCELSRLALAGLKGTEHLINEKLPIAYLTNGRSIGNWLGDILNARPGSNDTGGMILPVLTQRRKSVRVTASKKCKLLTDTGSAQALISNVSTHGLGISSHEPLSVGQPVRVELDNGRILDAIVAWQKSTRAGLQLLKPLVRTDPILTSPGA